MCNENNGNSETNSTGGNASNIPVAITPGWRQQVSDVLHWLHERAWPLTGVMLIVAAIYLNGFIIEEKVPLSIASPSMITALPMLFAFLLLFIVVIVGLLFIPTTIFFSHINRVRRLRLVDSVFGSNVSHARWTFPIGWLLIPACMIFLIFMLWNFVSDEGQWMKIVVVLLSFVLAILSFVMILLTDRSLNLHWRDISIEFYMSFFGCLIAQFFLTIFILHASLNAAQPTESYGIFALYSFVGVFTLSVVQLGLARYVASQESQSSLGICLIGGFALIILLGLYPMVASKLAGGVLQFTASGARNCAVFGWTLSNPEGVKQEIIDSENSDKSKSLRILIDVDEKYLVRPKNADTKIVYFVPRSIVSSIDDCPKSTPTSK